MEIMTMTTIEQVVERIGEFVRMDLLQKSISDMMLSAIEELGEFAREVKIEDGVPGNAHKQIGEDGSIGEAIDLIIMAFALYHAREGDSSKIAERMMKKLDKWEAVCET
jgi:NTP pyrophosphatase (non-canonical NTP hydrolase)